MILAVIQARMSSSRLPGKVLLEIAGKPMLQWVVERALLAKTVDQVVVATTTDPADDPIAAFCEAQGYLFTRGAACARRRQALGVKADIVVRTADCHCWIRLLVRLSNCCYYDLDLQRIACRHWADYPWPRRGSHHGCLGAWRETREAHFREHVMPYFYDDLPLVPLAAVDSDRSSSIQPDRTSHVALSGSGRPEGLKGLSTSHFEHRTSHVILRPLPEPIFGGYHVHHFPNHRN
jgi:hypothetical protein